MTGMEQTASVVATLSAPPPASEPSSSGKERRQSYSSVGSMKKERSPDRHMDVATQHVLLSKEDSDRDASTEFRRPGKIGTFAWPVIAIVILGWWVSSIVLPFSRHRWYVHFFFFFYTHMTVLISCLGSCRPCGHGSSFLSSCSALSLQPSYLVLSRSSGARPLPTLSQTFRTVDVSLFYGLAQWPSRSLPLSALKDQRCGPYSCVKT